MLGVLLVVGSGLGFALWAGRVGDRAPVLALARTVHAGHAITTGDLTSVRVGADQHVETLDPARRSDVVGRVARVDLPGGTLLQESVLTGSSLVAEGRALVGISVDRGRLPLGGLHAGDRVLVVETPSAEGLPAPSGESGATDSLHVWAGTVFAQDVLDSTAETETVALSIELDEVDAVEVSIAAARDAVRVVLVHRPPAGR